MKSRQCNSVSILVLLSSFLRAEWQVNYRLDEMYLHGYFISSCNQLYIGG